MTPGLPCLELQYDEALCNFAFNFNLRRIAKAVYREETVFQGNAQRKFIDGLLPRLGGAG
jgi:hypothetical protein